MKKLLIAIAFFLLPAMAYAQSAPVHFLSAASNNSTIVQTGKVVLHVLLPINTTATLYYLKLYDKATAPTCGTDVPKLTVPVPSTGTVNQGGGVSLPSADGLVFINGFGFCLTGGIADNDNTSAATGIVLNFGIGTN